MENNNNINSLENVNLQNKLNEEIYPILEEIRIYFNKNVCYYDDSEDAVFQKYFFYLKATTLHKINNELISLFNKTGHNHDCSCMICKELKNCTFEICKEYYYPFIENGAIGSKYPSLFIEFINSIKIEDKINFYIENQEFVLLEDIINPQINFASKVPKYDDFLCLATVAYFASESLKLSKHKIYEDYLLLPFAKINGEYGYLFFLSKIDGVSDGKVYYFDIDAYSSRISLIDNDFRNLLYNKTWQLSDIFDKKYIISEFLDNHQIQLDNKNKFTFFELKEIGLFANNNICTCECYFKLFNVNSEGKHHCFTNISNNFSIFFLNNSNCYQLNYFVTFTDNIDDEYYQKMYERYFFYNEKENPKTYYAEIKLRLKMIFYSTILRLNTFLNENGIDLLHVMNDECLAILEKHSTQPIEIDYYED